MIINVINVGCFKNLVDCEKLIYQLEAGGNTVFFGEKKEFVDIVIVNTCGFIDDAEGESLSVLRKCAERKRHGMCRSLFVMGCLSQKKGYGLKSEIPEIDRIYGNFNWLEILTDLGSIYADDFHRHLTTPAHYAYLKISEGCNMPCSYCIKPILNGSLHSVDIKALVEECKYLVSKGVKEFNIVAQNLTSYGEDLYGAKRITELLQRISDIPGVDWIRLHYAYPVGFPISLLDVMNERENVCKYLDIAVQHCSTKMLRLMRRGMTYEMLVGLIDKIREKVPGIYLRTTVMTGHPGEGEKEFEELKRFVIKQRFERLGVFPYSHQQGSFCFDNYSDIIPENVKRARALELMKIQRDLYEKMNYSLIGNIVDTETVGGYYGRSQHSTPIADPKVVITSDRKLDIGGFYDIEYTEIVGKDIKGKVCI